MKQLLLDIQLPAKPSLDNFLVGSNAEAIHTISQGLTAQATQRFIYLWGAPGSGKTHLLSATRDAAEGLGKSLVMADDVQDFSEQQQIDLFNAYNQARENDSLVLVAGNASPMQMGLRDDLASRLAWGVTYQLHPLSDEEKAQALKARAKQRGMKLPDDVVDYCFRYLRRDLPSLMATLDALDQWSLTEKKPITVAMLRKLIQVPLL
jgi:DnaA family protein